MTIVDLVVELRYFWFLKTTVGGLIKQADFRVQIEVLIFFIESGFEK